MNGLRVNVPARQSYEYIAKKKNYANRKVD